MTAVKSSKKSFFWTRYLNNLKGNSKHFIVNIILELLGLPVLSVIAIIGFYYDNKENMTAAESVMQDTVMAGCIPFAVLACCTLAASILMGSMIALSQYSYLYKKTITDMNYSLPLSTTQRFFADYLSGFTIYIGIPLCAIALSLGILGVGSIFVNMSELWHNMPDILALVFIVVIAMVQYYTMAVFALSFCGNTFESHFSIIAFAVMIPATIGCLWAAITTSSAFGMVTEAVFDMSIFTSTNPIGAAVFFFEYIDNIDSIDRTNVLMYAKWAVVTLVVTALYLGGAYLLQRFRKAEDVSKPYVYRSFFYVIMTMGTFCVLSLFIIGHAFIGAGIVICAVVWFIMEVITRRGFKKFWTAPVAFVTAVVSVFAICWICDVTDGFGASKRVPAPLSISSVTLGIDDIGAIEFKDKDVIKASVELNKEIVDRHFNPQNYEYNTVNVDRSSVDMYDDLYIDFSYKTLAGSTARRRYRINSGMTSKLVKAIMLSDEYAVYNASKIGDYYSIDDFGLINLEIKNKIGHEAGANTSKFTLKKRDEIRTAYITDMKNMTEEELINGDVYCFMGDVWVLKSFENTIKALDVNIPELSSNTINSVRILKNPKIFSDVQGYIESDNGYSYYYYWKENSDGYRPVLVDSITKAKPHYYGYSGEENALEIGRFDKTAVEILNNCTPYIIGEMPLAFVTVGSRTYYLRNTPENAELLDSANLYNKIMDDVVQDIYGWDEDWEIA